MQKQMKALFLTGILLIVGLSLVFGCSARLTDVDRTLLEDSLKAADDAKAAAEKADQAVDKTEASAMDAESAARRAEAAADAADQAAQNAALMHENCERIFNEAMK